MIICNVYDLFDCFSKYFGIINYYDSTNNVEDTICCKVEDIADKNEKFLEEYGTYIVRDFRYNYEENYIYILLEDDTDE